MILVTGCAGFIGFHVCRRLLQNNVSVIGIDNLNDYYDVELKRSRLKQIDSQSFKFILCDLSDKTRLNSIFQQYQIQYVINLAAQAGVRYSIENPSTYIESNIQGFINILECSRQSNIKHLIYASSSSVYGANELQPYEESHPTNHPRSVYAATKKSNELLAHVYASIYQLPVTGLRFFTVYGPWGRPDMALFKFTKAILSGQPIDVYNNGKMKRDFTYIDDIVDGIISTVDSPATSDNNWNPQAPDADSSYAPFKLYNIGNNTPVDLMHCIHLLEKELDKKAIINYMPLQSGDVLSTHANIESLRQDFNYSPSVSLSEGIAKFVEWYSEYYATI